MLSYLQNADVIERWADLKPHIQRVIDKCDCDDDVDSVMEKALSGRCQIWAIPDRKGVIITELQEPKRHKQLFVYMVSGKDADEWLDDAEKELVEFAKYLGCDRIISMGREGWGKITKRLGYSPLYTCVVKRL